MTDEQSDRVWVSVDPGGTTGLAFWREGVLEQWDAVRCGFNWKEQMGLVGLLAERVWDWVGYEGTVVLEDFILRSGGVKSTKRDALGPVQVSGLMLGHMASWGWEGQVVLQSAGNAKSLVTDGRLRTMGLYRGNEHVRDAIRHGVIYMRKVGIRRG